MESLKTILKRILPDLTASSPLADILTEQEKQQAINHAVKIEIRRYFARHQQNGLSVRKIEEKASKVDFLARVNASEVLEQANRLKHREIEQSKADEERKISENKNRERLAKECNANYFYNLIRQYFKFNYGRFDFDDSNRKYITAVCYFMSNDSRFETELGYSFKKGLWVQGTAGLGKTKVIEAVKDNPLYPVKIVSLIEIAEAVREHGQVQLNTDRLLLLDDVGSEQADVKHYGTPINWFKDFMEDYYLKNKVYTRLLITTNCGGDEIEKRYGYRVRSRVREMFNQIALTGVDRRV